MSENDNAKPPTSTGNIEDVPVDDASVADETASETQAETQQNSAPDAEADAETAEPEVTEAAAPPKAKGRGLAWFALLLGLSAAGGVGYLYYELVYKNPIGALASRAETSASDFSAQSQTLIEQMAALEDANRAAIDEAGEAQQAAIGEYEARVLASLQDALEAAPPSQKEWKLAEAEYLMRIANHRVLMEQDSAGAVELLSTADQILKELDDFALHEVRARLADETLALKQVPKNDLQGIYLRLDALKNRLSEVAIKAPEMADEAPPDATLTVWQQLAEATADFVRVRTLTGDETVKPLLAPEEQQYLELNMRLALEQAQLAALRRHQAVYEQALQSLREWLEKYADERALPLIEEIDALMTLRLAHPLPDVSGSLASLLEARSGRASTASEEPDDIGAGTDINDLVPETPEVDADETPPPVAEEPEA